MEKVLLIPINGSHSLARRKRRSVNLSRFAPLLGYVIDILGPFRAALNDAEIMRSAVTDDNGLGGFVRAGDICFVDRGFRDVELLPRSEAFAVCMPSLKGNTQQLTAEEADSSRFVTKIRWVV